MPNASNTDRVRDADRRRRDDRTSGPCSPSRARRRSERLATVLPGGGGRRPVPGRPARRGTASPCTVAGTGYTGERGRRDRRARRRRRRRCGTAIVAAGVAPAGLGARDTLRLEAGLPLHGHELGPGITPLQAGLGWVVAWGKPDVPRPRRARRRARARASPATSSASPPRAAGRRGPGAPMLVDGEVGRRGHERQLLAGARPRHRPRLRAAGRRRRRHGGRRSTCAAPRLAGTVVPTPFVAVADVSAPRRRTRFVAAACRRRFAAAFLAAAASWPPPSSPAPSWPAPSWRRRRRRPASGARPAPAAGAASVDRRRGAAAGDGLARASPGMRSPNRPPACSASWPSGDIRRTRSLMTSMNCAEVASAATCSTGEFSVSASRVRPGDDLIDRRRPAASTARRPASPCGSAAGASPGSAPRSR